MIQNQFGWVKITFKENLNPKAMYCKVKIQQVLSVPSTFLPVPHSLLPDTAPATLVLPELELLTIQRLLPEFQVQKGAPAIVLQKSTHSRWLSTTFSTMSFPL